MILQEEQVSVLTTMSISEILAGLKKRGYQLKFRREATCLYCVELNLWITPESFIVDEYYHFEDSSNIDGDRTLYAISSTQGLKGFLADPCFAYEDNISSEMLQKLNPEDMAAGEFLIQ